MSIEKVSIAMSWSSRSSSHSIIKLGFVLMGGGPLTCLICFTRHLLEIDAHLNSKDETRFILARRKH